MNELPAGWCRCALGDIVDGFQTGRNLAAMGIPAAHGQCGVLKISAVSWGAFNPTENKGLLPGDQPKQHELVRAGDLLITRANTTELVGAVVLVEKDHPELMLPDKILRIRYDDRVVCPQFLLQALRTDTATTHFREQATGTSDSMRNLSQPKLLQTPIRLAPLNEQRRIVDKIEALNAKSRRAKEALGAIPPLLEKFRQSILAAAFRGDLTADWRAKNPDVEPASKLLERIRTERRRRWEEAELEKLRAKGTPPKDDRWKAKYKEPATSGVLRPSVPDTWTWTESGLVGDILLGRRRAPEYRDGRPNRQYLRVANVKDGALDFEDVEEMGFTDAEFALYRLQPGDVLVSEGQSLERIGQAALFSGYANPVAFQSTLHRWRPNRVGPTGEFACFVFRAHSRSGMFRQHASITTNIAHLTLTKLQTVPFPLPPEDEQSEITRRLSVAFAAIDRIAMRVRAIGRELARQNEAILAKAFRGELVPQDPADEPASVLLERIRAERNGQVPASSQRIGRKRAPKRQAAE